MIIHQPEIIRKNDNAILWSKIELDRKRDNFPDYIWYRVPEQYAPYLSTQSDAFLTSALIAAMHFGENIEVRGTISPRLAYSLNEYQFVMSFWLSQYLKQIEISYKNLQIENVKPKGVAATFSGGVDSFFTIKTHLPETQPISEYQITHALFTQGFDILHKEKAMYQALYSRYQKVLKELNIELVSMTTNAVRTIIPNLNFIDFYGPVLASYGAVFSGLFKRFYIASSLDYYQLAMRASSSSPLPDRLLSTETLDIIHVGATHRRIEKIEALSDWEPAQEHLRVCHIANVGDENINCSRCEKCSRTMVPLYTLGKMEIFKTFSKPFKSKRDILWSARKYDPRKINYAPEAFIFAKKHNPNILPWLYLAAFLGSIRYYLLRLLPYFMKIWLRRYGFFIDDLKEENAFETPEIIKLIENSLKGTKQ